jgi:diketogulonate reductase-like aldo/keto reductase
MDVMTPDRRTVLKGLAASGALVASPFPALAQTPAFRTKPIPSSGEEIPLVGLGTWQTFNVGEDTKARNACADVMEAFFAAGGTLIDSSPMYGSSQPVVGYGLERIGRTGEVFSADKVWTSSEDEGPEQIEESRREWRVPRFTLLQVHNLRAWRAHLDLLNRMKADGELRYVGITTSHGRRHDEFEQVMREHPLDFIQVTYNMADREVEDRILPLAREKGIAVIANRPYQGGALIDRMQRHKLPAWAEEYGFANWPEFLLKFIVSHPAVTCAIPATTRVEHARENMGASRGGLPNEALRRRMVNYAASL